MLFLSDLCLHGPQVITLYKTVSFVLVGCFAVLLDSLYIYVFDRIYFDEISASLLYK